MNRKILFCECTCPTHNVVFDIDEYDGNKDLIVYAKLNHFRSFYERLKISILYLIGLDVKEIEYCEVVLNKEKIKELKNIVEEALI